MAARRVCVAGVLAALCMAVWNPCEAVLVVAPNCTCGEVSTMYCTGVDDALPASLPVACQANTTDIFFEKTNISVIPDTFFTGASPHQIGFTHSKLTAIASPGPFTGPEVIDVFFLELQHNAITSIDDGAFAGLVNLTALDLSYNLLTEIQSGVFSQLTNLGSLDLSHNSLQAMPSVPAALARLHTLILNHNEIPALATADIDHFDDLAYLYLGNNVITEVEADALASFTNLVWLTLNNNKLTATPLLPDGSPGLQTVFFHNNNISLIPSTLTTFWANKNLMYSFSNNPSVCFRVADPDNGVFTLCDCVSGFYGSDFCDAVDDFVELPNVLVRSAPYTFSHPLLDGNQVVTSGQFLDELGTTTFLLNFSDSTSLQVSIPDTVSSFAVVKDDGGDSTSPTPPQQLTVVTGLHSAIPSGVVEHAVSSWIPTSLTYSSSSAMPTGVTFSGNWLQGTPTSSGAFNIQVTAVDDISGDTKTAAQISLTVNDCGVDTCSNGGTCIDTGGTFDGSFECSCGSSFTGNRCQTSFQASTDAATTNAGIAGGVVGIVLLLLLAALVLYRKRKLLEEARKHRKEYHVFISYRVTEDQDIAAALCAALQEHLMDWNEHISIKLKCFWDAQDIKDGSNWKDTFLNGLEHCCLFVPIVSEGTIAPMKAITPSDTKDDNVLLEYELAVRLASEARLDVFPVLVGNRKGTEDGQIPKFDFSIYGGHMFPKTCSRTSHTETIRDTINSILAFQGVFLRTATDGPAGLSVYPRPSQGPDADTSLVNIILQVLRDAAWDNDENPLCIRGKRHWALDGEGMPLYAQPASSSQTAWVAEGTSFP